MSRVKSGEVDGGDLLAAAEHADFAVGIARRSAVDEHAIAGDVDHPIVGDAGGGADGRLDLAVAHLRGAGDLDQQQHVLGFGVGAAVAVVAWPQHHKVGIKHPSLAKRHRRLDRKVAAILHGQEQVDIGDQVPGMFRPLWRHVANHTVDQFDFVTFAQEARFDDR